MQSLANKANKKNQYNATVVGPSQMNTKRFLLLSLLWITTAMPALFLSSTLQAAPSIMLPDSSFDLQITPYLSILEDPSGSLTIEDILTSETQRKFIHNHSNNLRFNLSDSNYWLRFSITNPNPEDQSLVLSISNNRLENIEFYEYKAGQLNHQSSGGLAKNKAQGSHSQAYPFLIEVQAKKHQTYFIEIHSTNAINTLLRLQSNDQFLQSQQFDFSILGMALGWILASGFFFTLIWHFYHFRSALISAFYCSSMFIFIPAWLGQWATWFPQSQVWKDEIILLSLMASAIIQTLLTINLNWNSTNSKVISHMFNGILAMNVTSTLIYFFLPSGTMTLLMLSTIVMTNVFLASILLFAKSENEKAQFFLLVGHILIVCGILLSILTTHNILAFDFINNWSAILLPLAMIICTIFANLSIVANHRKNRKRQINTSDIILPELLAKLGHEFRTPINGVMGMSELLSDTRLTHTQRDYLDTISLAGGDLLHLVSEMSDFAKLQSGRINLEHRAFDLANCLTQCMNRYQQEANRKQIELVLDIADDISPRLVGDQYRLQTIITNLIAQSLRYTESGELELRVFHMGLNNHEGIFFQFQLTGSLIEHDELRRLFRTMAGPQEQFSKVNIDQGLGLIIVKRLVGLMEGSIEVETLTHDGCSITLFLPIKEELSERIEEDSDLLAGQRILIVDDNSIFRGVIEKQVKRWGMRAESTHNGKQALALMRNKANLGEPYDYIVVDHNMPIMNGIQLTERLMADNDIEPKPIRIMLTGLGIGSVNQAAKEAGIQKVINKPVSGRHLKEVLLDFHKLIKPLIMK
ncbi:MAG: signal transduction histidine kinase/CheY-like chemotaxis protein [Oleispira sp.]